MAGVQKDATESRAPEETREEGRNRGLVFHVSLLYNLCLANERTRPWWSAIEQHLILGALPLRDKNHLEQLVDEWHVKAVVSMNERFELLPNLMNNPVTPSEWKQVQVDHLFGSTEDFAPPTVETIARCVQFVHEHVDVRQETTYVHCKAGRGRSTVVVIAFCMRHRGMTNEEAFQLVKSKRPHVNLHPKQVRVLQEYQSSLDDVRGR